MRSTVKSYIKTWDNEILAFNLQDRKRGFSNWVSLCNDMKGFSTPLQTFDLNFLVSDYFEDYYFSQNINSLLGKPTNFELETLLLYNQYLGLKSLDGIASLT